MACGRSFPILSLYAASAARWAARSASLRASSAPATWLVFAPSTKHRLQVTKRHSEVAGFGTVSTPHVVAMTGNVSEK